MKGRLMSIFARRFQGIYITAAFALRRYLLKLANAIVPSALPLYEMTSGIAQTQIVASFVELNVAQALSEKDTSLAALAAYTNTQPDMLERFLRASLSLGLVQRRRDGRYRSTAFTRALHFDTRDGMAAFARYMASRSNVTAWGKLTDVVRTGTNAFEQVNGSAVWPYLASHPEEEALFAQAMTSFARMDGPAIARAYPFGRHAVLCDLGGGRGAFLEAILAHHPGTEGLVVDRASVISSEGAAVPAEVSARLKFAAGSFFDCLPAGCDAYLLRHVLHDWDDAACQKILQRCRDAMKPASRLLIIESCVEPGHRSYLGTMKDLTMGVICGGRERSISAMRTLLAGSKLSLLQIWPTAAPVVVWEVAVMDVA